MTRHLSRVAAVVALLLAPLAAAAAPAMVTTRLDLKAGPGAEYPAVAFLEPGLQVEVMGCLEGYGWCDVVVGQDRGWVPGAFLQAGYEHRQAPLVRVAPSLGLPVVGFSVGSYWERNYRDRPWYAERGRWDRGFGGPPPGWHRERDWNREREGRRDADWDRRGPGHGPEWRRDDRDGGPRGWPERDGRGGPDGPRHAGGPDRGGPPGFDRGPR